MKGNPEVIALLNQRLSEEHAAHVQYTTHASMCKNWGYEGLSEYLFKRAAEEKEHAQELIDRILFLDGIPLYAEIAPVIVGNEVCEMFPIDRESELGAIAGYIEGIKLSVEKGDFTTRKLLEHILEEEEQHLNDIESNIAQITQAGYENYLAVQIKE